MEDENSTNVRAEVRQAAFREASHNPFIWVLIFAFPLAILLALIKLFACNPQISCEFDEVREVAGANFGNDSLIWYLLNENNQPINNGFHNYFLIGGLVYGKLGGSWYRLDDYGKVIELVLDYKCYKKDGCWYVEIDGYAVKYTDWRGHELEFPGFY